MRTIMVEPVGNICNLRCRYCYQMPTRLDKKPSTMPITVLEKIISDSITLSDTIKFLWHGGEPMLAGIDFFKTAIELQKKLKKTDVRMINAIQTNATLINQEWAEFFAKNKFSIGTSIDGTQELHNKVRDNSFSKVIRGIRYLQDAGVGVGVIITVTSYNVNYPDLIWNNLIKPKKISDHFDINVCFSKDMPSLIPNLEQSLSFMTKLFDLWIEEDDPVINIRTFRGVLRFLLGGRAGDCAFEYNKCSRFVAIDDKGDIYTCNRFMKQEVAYLGNILEINLKDILKSKKVLALYEKIAKIKDECRKCEWLECCGGGCAFQRWLHTGFFDAGFPECEFRKKFFSYVREKCFL